MATLELPDNADEFTGEVWVKSYGNNNYDLSARFYNSNNPDILVTFHIDNKEKMDLLVGAFMSFDSNNHRPMHGMFYLQWVNCKPIDAKVVGRKAFELTAIDPKVRLSLFRQTHVLKFKNQSPLPNYVHATLKTLQEDLLGYTFIGYFINTKYLRLENFLFSFDQNGQVQIRYHGVSQPQIGLYRLFFDRMIWLGLDYDFKSRLYRYRMNFQRHKQTEWYLGNIGGSDKKGIHQFMSRVAILRTKKDWNTTPVEVPIEFTDQERPLLNALYKRLPIVKEYLSGELPSEIPMNELLSETPYLLRKAGLLTEPIVPEVETARNFDGVKGKFLLYSLSRNAGLEDDDDTFEIVEMPLKIESNGSLELKGNQRTYFGQATWAENKLVLQFNQRKDDDSTFREPAFTTCYIKITPLNERITKYSVGTSIRFLNTMPEARTELLVQLTSEPDGEQTESYKTYTFFTEKWLTLSDKEEDGSTKDYIMNYFAGRANRMIVPHDSGHKKPTKRQDFFRLLFGHAAKDCMRENQAQQFFRYFYQAVCHGLNRGIKHSAPLDKAQKAEMKLYETLCNHFRKVYPNRKEWGGALERKAETLHLYLHPTDSSNPPEKVL
ncbi:hypothetical protein GCM10027347_50650 [Larkinella harenae]